MAAKKKAAKRTTARKPAQKRTKKKVATGSDATVPQVGTTIKREFKGVEHAVKVAVDGFTYDGETYRTLTAVAKAITGYASISGPRFFGTDAAAKGGAK